MFAQMDKPAPVAENSRTMFLIPQQNYKKFEAEIAKLSEKSKKAGGWEIVPCVIGYKIDRNTEAKSYEVFLDAPDVQIEGYRFIATLDHSQETGNIIRMVPNKGVTLPTSYREVAPDCDHCHIRRIRRDTYVIQNIETGEFKQVGSTCLQGFFKTDPRAIARLAELLGYASELAEVAQKKPTEHKTMVLRDERYIDLVEYLENTAAAIRVFGWVSGKTAYETGRLSTANVAYGCMVSAQMQEYSFVQARHEAPVTDEDRAVVVAALEWARGLRNKPELNDYENNVTVLADAQFIEGRSAGTAASIVGVYLMQAAREAQRNKPRASTMALGDMSAVIALFQTAGSKLKNPKIAIDLPEVGEVVLTMAKPHHKVPGSINVKTPGGFDNADWYGRIHSDGRYDPSRIAPKALETGLRAFATDPAGMASAHGHKTGQCCFCSIPLKDARSVEVGYGKTCAGNYNLPWGKKA